MDAFYAALAVCVGVAILLIGISIPLYLEKIKRNYYYGFRTPKTLSSDAIWFPAKRSLGLHLIFAGIVIMVAACGSFLLKSTLTVPVLVGIMIFVTIVSVVGAVIKSFMVLRRY